LHSCNPLYVQHNEQNCPIIINGNYRHYSKAMDRGSVEQRKKGVA